MGRNSSGVINKSSEGNLTVGQIGLHPKALKAFGGEKYIGGLVNVYNKALKQSLNEFSSQINGVTSKSTREISALNGLVDYFKTHKEYGTKSSFVNYVRRSANSVISGNYKDSLLKNGGLAKEIVESYAVAHAKRLLIPKIVRHLKGL